MIGSVYVRNIGHRNTDRHSFKIDLYTIVLSQYTALRYSKRQQRTECPDNTILCGSVLMERQSVFLRPILWLYTEPYHSSWVVIRLNDASTSLDTCGPFIINGIHLCYLISFEYVVIYFSSPTHFFSLPNRLQRNEK